MRSRGRELDGTLAPPDSSGASCDALPPRSSRPSWSACPRSARGRSRRPDRLAAEIDRWAAFLRTNASTDEDWTQVKQVSEPVMARAQSALRDGRRLLALQRLAALEGNLAAVGLGPGAARVGEGRGRLRGRVEADGRGAARPAGRAPRRRARRREPRPRARGRRGGVAAGAGLLRREPGVRAEHRAGVRPLLPRSGPGGGGAGGPLPLALDPDGEEGAARPRAGHGDRGAPGRRARRVPAAGGDRLAPRLHHHERRAQGGARAGRGGAALRRSPALPAGVAPLRARCARPRRPIPPAPPSACASSTRSSPPGASTTASGGSSSRSRRRRRRAGRPRTRPPPPRSRGTSCPATSRHSRPRRPLLRRPRRP